MQMIFLIILLFLYLSRLYLEKTPPDLRCFSILLTVFLLLISIEKLGQKLGQKLVVLMVSYFT